MNLTIGQSFRYVRNRLSYIEILALLPEYSYCRMLHSNSLTQPLFAYVAHELSSDNDVSPESQLDLFMPETNRLGFCVNLGIEKAEDGKNGRFN